MDRRRDVILRNVVEHFRPELERCGFHLDRRGNSTNHSWVQFRRPARDPSGHDGILVLTMAHGRDERALLVDTYFVDTALTIETPQRKFVHRYESDVDWSNVVHQLVGDLRPWTS